MPPNPPGKAHGFSMRSMSRSDMQISKSEKNNYWPPPCQILATPLHYLNFGKTWGAERQVTPPPPMSIIGRYVPHPTIIYATAGFAGIRDESKLKLPTVNAFNELHQLQSSSLTDLDTRCRGSHFHAMVKSTSHLHKTKNSTFLTTFTM